MYALIVLYRQPLDVEAFDHHYRAVHTPKVAALPGLESFSVVRPQAGPGGVTPDYYLVATLTFASEEVFAAALASPLGNEVQDDLANFATAGVVLLPGPVTNETAEAS